MNIVLFNKNEILSQNGNLLKVDIKDFRVKHIENILNLQKDDLFNFGIVNDSNYKAKIISLDSGAFCFEIVEKLPLVNLYPVVLAVSQVRPICMKRILREAVTLGASEIALIGTDKSEKSYKDAKLYTSGEYKKYLLDGAMQSGSCMMSKVSFYDDVDSFLLEYSSDEYEKIVLDNVEESSSLSQLETKASVWTILAIGGERGWSDRERSLFKAYSYDFKLIGSRILRTETACSVGLGVLLSKKNLL